MNEDGYVLAAIGGVVIVSVVVELVRRRYLRGRFALVWLAVAAATTVLAIFPDLLGWAARSTNIKVPLNLLLFGGFLGLLIIILHLSAEFGRLEERTRILAEEIAMLRSQTPVDASQGGTSNASPEANDSK